MDSAKGLHLWVAVWGTLDPALFITTRLFDASLALKRAKDTAKKLEYRGRFSSITYQGTIDA